MAAPAGPRLTIEQMLKELAPFGIKLRTGATLQMILDYLREDGRFRGEDPRSVIEKEGYEWMLMVLGEELYENTPRRRKCLGPNSEAVWHFDAECIEDPDSYAVIARRAELISGGDLVFNAVDGNVDHDAQEAWVDLTWRGRKERIEMSYQNDWADERVFEHLQRYLVATGTERRYAIQILGQDMLIVCQTPEALSRLNKLTGLKLEIGKS